MTRQKMQNRNTRKITRVGNASLGVTLPVEDLRELGWREKQKVIVKRTKEGFSIRDWKK